jgi:hypothetical protein
MDHAKISYYSDHPDEVPVPDYLALAIPVTEEDFSSGQLAHLMSELSTHAGFRDMQAQQLQACLAAGFGYASWDALVALDGAMADESQLPPNSQKLEDAIAWRMYVAGFVGLYDALAGVSASWRSGLLAVSRSYGNSGFCESQDHRSWENFCHRRVRGLEPSWYMWDKIVKTGPGMVRVKCAAECAWEVANMFWSPDCGVPLEKLNEDIASGACMPTRTLTERSWGLFDAWPTGLQPVQFANTDGTHVGYGWAWPEVGLVHGSVFSTPSDLKESAVALWERHPTQAHALKTLPEKLVQVEFKNPWSPSEYHADVTASLSATVGLGDPYPEGPLLELLPTRNGRLFLGRELMIDGEPWSGPVRLMQADHLEGILGLQLPSVLEARLKLQGECDWMEEKVPYAFDQHTFETSLRLAVAITGLAESERMWLKQDQAALETLSTLLALSALKANPVASQEAQFAMEDPWVRAVEAPDAAREMIHTYPELSRLSPQILGDYGLAFYGKDGLRHDHKHTERDPEFMVYSILRNLGTDPQIQTHTDMIALFRLVRLHTHGKEAVWLDSNQRDTLSQQTRDLCAEFWALDSLFDVLDHSLSPSRLSKADVAGAGETSA